jgi:predicted ribosome quality control (RQC) complex YloA/Tae2 family protein
MLSSYFTLFHIASLLDRRYARTVIAEVYSQEKNTLSILVYAPEPHTVTVCCNARENYITAREKSSRTHQNTIDLFPALIDRHIESVQMSPTDRVIVMNISGGLRLCLEMFASTANVVLVDETGTVIDAFLNKNETMAHHKKYPLAEVPVSLHTILPEMDTMARSIADYFNETNDIVRAVKKTAPKLGTILAEEIVYRSGVPRQTCSAESAAKVTAAAVSIVEQLIILSNITPLVYFDDRAPLCFSLIPLEHLSDCRSERYDDLFTGIQRFISFERSTSTYLQKKKEIASWLQKETQKAERTIRAVESELAEASRAERYQSFANLIMTHLSGIERGASTFSADDPAEPGRTVTVPLETSISPQKNAERYFEKAKKARNGREESKDRLHVLQKRLQSLQSLLEKINSVANGISLKNFLQSYQGMVKELGYMTEQEQEELPPFKIFTVEGGFTVYAGKNSVNNDLLTFRYAKPNDLWFHARGSSGSHVVLKLGTGQGAPSKKAVEQAASIAAYYSKMKNAKHVPVAMTERKYIHKPKGAPAGTVALDKEKVIFVQPVLPDQKV